jgi:hypothetical protein
VKATDFNLPQEISFNLETGITSFKNTRLLLFDADAIGLLRQKLIEELGPERAREFFLKLGYQNGYADFMQMKINYKFDTEMDLFASGPVLHTWEGIVHATAKEFRCDRENGEFYFSGIWTNSYEAEQHLSYNLQATEPICWSLVGYASGWSTAFFGSPLIAIEHFCVGRGDDHCEWIIKTPEEWGAVAEPYLAAYQQFYQPV